MRKGFFLDSACALGPGLVAFVLVVGVRPLLPWNVGWILTPDPLKDYLGWTFFRHGPWSWPLGANPAFGLDKLGSSIFFSDSIPLLALLFKPLSRWLPEPFQYLGLWELACFILQSGFAWQLLGVATGDRGLRTLGTVLFVFAPPLLMRVGVHHALVGQWTVVAALWLVLAPPGHRALAWTVLTVVTALLHPYLMVMVMALWAAAWVAGWTTPHRRVAALCVETGIVLAGVGAALWQAGAFLLQHGLEREGFGFYRMNLNALINPRVDESTVWSYVFPSLHGASPGEYEGFNFLGLGAAACVGLALGLLVVKPDLVRKVRWSRWWPLGGMSLVLGLVAVSNDVSLGGWTVHYPWPERLVTAMGAVRSSGRLFWPVFYLLLFLSFAIVVRTLSRRVALGVLAVCAALQVIDLSAGWIPRHRLLNDPPLSRAFASPLRDPFWTQAGSIYRRLRVIHWRPLLEHWSDLAIYADHHRMSTEAAYLTRVDRDRIDRLEARQIADWHQRRWDPDALYIVDEDLAREMEPHVDRNADLLERIDGLWVFAPRWVALGNGHGGG